MNTAQLFLFVSALTLTASNVFADDSANPAPAATNGSAGAAADNSGATNYYSTPPQKQPKKKKKKKAKSAEEAGQGGVQELTLPMSKGELEAEVDADVAQRERANAPHTNLELDVSSWKPNSVSTPSQLTNTTAYTSKGIPAMDVDFYSPIGNHTFSLEFGLGFLALERTGTLSTSGINIPQSQNGYITMLRAGVTYSPWLFFGDKLVPYGEALLLPTLFLSKSSAFDDGTSQFGVPVSIGAGTIYKFSKSFALDLGLTGVLGSVQGSNYNGFGVHGGIRVQI